MVDGDPKDIELYEKEISKILENANLKKTSSKKVRQQLEKNLGVDLSDQRKMIDELVMNYVNKILDNENDDEDEDEDESEEEEQSEEEKKPSKRFAKPKTAKKRKASTDEDEADDGSDSDSDGAKKKKPSPKKKGRKKGGDSDSDWDKKKGKGKKGGAKGGRGYTRSYKLSPELSELMGADEMPRHEVVKRVWAIIKERKLYDPNNKQFAICDEELLKVFGAKRFRTFGMMKYLKNHFIG